MKRNPIIPFLLIMVLGISAMFLMSFKGIGDMKEIASEKEDGGEKTEETAAAPEELYQQKGCVACHGSDYQGVGSNPALIGVGDRLSHDEIADILVNGKGTMPQGLLTEEQAPEMAEWLSSLK